MARTRENEPAAASSAPAPRFATAWASLVYAIATLTLAYPALSGAFLLNPLSDQYKAGYAFREYAAQELRSGRGFPQWNPFVEGGLPYVAAMHGDIFYPTFLLRMIMPTDMAMTWEFPIHLFLCGLFTFLFLRAWNFGFFGALMGGLAYMLGGSIAGYAGPGHDGKLFVSTMLPLALLLLTYGIRDGRLWSWGALAITIGLAVLSPHPQLLQYMLLTCGVFALYLAFAKHGDERLPRADAIKRLVAAAGAVALGMLMGAIQYWPAVFEYKPWSPRAAGHDWATATSYSFPIEETLNAYWPNFSGILMNYWGRNIIHFHSDYFGVIVLMLVGCAFGASQWKSFRRFWVVTGIIGLLWAFGGYTPFFKLVFALVPGTKFFRAPSTIIYIPAFAVAVLAAIGTERLVARRVSVKYPLIWAAVGLAFAALMSVGGYSVFSGTVVSSICSSMGDGCTEVLTQRADANAGEAILGVWRSFAFVALGAVLMWAWLAGRLAARPAMIGLVAVLIVDLWSIERLYWTYLPRASQLYATDPAIDAIKADIAKSGEPARVWTWPFGQTLRDPIFNGDALMSHGLRMVGNYHGNELGTYQTLANVEAEGQIKFSPQFWRHENVRYLYTTANDSIINVLATQLKLESRPVLLAGPVRNAAGNMVFAYRLPGDARTARVAAAMVKAPENQSLATVLDPRFDPTRVAIVDTAAKDIQGQTLTALPEPATAKATVTATTDRSYTIALDQPSTAGSALVVSDNYYPGWRATADGKALPVARTNFNLIGIALPAGVRNVELRFTDAAYEKGKALTLASIAAALVLLGIGFAVDRRRPTPSSAPA